MQTKKKKSLRITMWVALISALALDVLMYLYWGTITRSIYYDYIFYSSIAYNVLSIIWIVFSIFKPNHGKEKLDLIGLLDDMPFMELNYQDTNFDSKQKGEKDAWEDEQDIDAPVIEKPKRVIPSKPVYDKPIDPSIYLDQLSINLIDNGLSVDKINLRETFASMASSKLVLVRNEHHNMIHRYLSVFTDFIGAQLIPIRIDDSITAFEDLLTSKYSLQAGIKHAVDNPNKLFIFSFRLSKLIDVETYLNRLIEFSLNPKVDFELVFPNQEVLKVPANVWFFVTDTVDKPINPSYKFYQSASLLNLNLKLVTPFEEVTENPVKLTYEAFSNLLVEGLNRYFVEEEYWKKMDLVENFVLKQTDFAMDNRLVRQLERYTSAFIMFGGDNLASLDSAIFNKLLRILLLLSFKPQPEEEEDIITVFEKSFGLDNLFKSKTLLKTLKESHLEE